MPASIRHLAPAGFVLSLVILTVVAPFGSLPGYALGAVLGTYILCTVMASAITAAKHGVKLLPILPLVFACYHFAYGLGFLRGIWDFMVLKRASPFAKNLTRTSAPAPSEKPRPSSETRI
jgi:succinoglycan biosynthesis protein ExoA